jgi:D-sedoheptulose 7-phosphate isomerase
MDKYWSEYRSAFSEALARVAATSADGTPMDMEQSMALLCDWARQARDLGASFHLVGNGASACMASHFAVDWTKNGGVRAFAYNDIAFLTAIGNDIGYEEVFAQPVRAFGRKGDLLVVISSSGQSPNVLSAMKAARDLELRIVTLTGMKPDNTARRGGDLNLYVPAWTYGIVESAHHMLLHVWIDRFLNVRDWELSAPQRMAPPQR